MFRTLLRHVLAVFVLTLSSGLAHAQVQPTIAGNPVGHAPVIRPEPRLGAIGDSLTDEYLEQSYSYARAWTELFVDEHDVEMGPTAFQAGVPGGSWGEPRRTGFEDNWARYGETTDGAIAQGQHNGLASGALTRDVDHAVMFIGGNDFAPWAHGTYTPLYNGSWSAAQITAWIDGRIANDVQMLNVLQPTGVEIVLASVIDFSPMPYISQGSYTDPARRELVAQALAQFRDAALQLADDRDVAFLDMYALNRALFGTNLAPNNSILVGNVAVDLLASDTGSGSNPQAAWVDDGIHPNTVIQGIWANAFATALNDVYAAGIPLFTEEQILANAGIAYGGADTLSAVIGNYSDYVIDFTP